MHSTHLLVWFFSSLFLFSLVYCYSLLSWILYSKYWIACFEKKKFNGGWFGEVIFLRSRKVIIKKKGRKR